MAIYCVFCRNLRVFSVYILFSKNFARVKKWQISGMIWYSWNVWRLYLCILMLFWRTLLTSCRRPQYDLLFQNLTQGPQFSCSKALIMIFYVEERDKNSWLIIIEMMMLIRQIWSADSLILTYGHTCTDTTDWKW